MLDTVLRVSSENFDVDKFVADFEIPDVDLIYRQGEAGDRRKVNSKSGINPFISEELDVLSNIAQIEKYIQQHAAAFEYLAENEVACEIDFGCTVGTKEQFTKSVALPLTLISSLHKYSIEVRFSAYPASDDDEI